MSLSGKTAIVTGATSGIGRAIACRFAEQGANVVIADVTTEVREGGEATAEVIRTRGGDAVFVHCDVSRWTDIDALVIDTCRRFGRLDIMVNNAAIFGDKLIIETTEEIWEQVMGINATGMFFGCKRAIQQMLTQEVRNEVRGWIINMASQYGVIGSPTSFAYGVSKACAIYMTRQISATHAKDHIVCNALAPGKIVTGKPGPTNDPQVIEYAKSRTPVPRLGRPLDVANAALFLASDEASFISGETLAVDGGWLSA